MNALRTIEVEPLGDQRWEKIESSLLARAERVLMAREQAAVGYPGRWRAAAAVLVAAAAMSALGFAKFGTREQPQHTGIEALSRIATGPNPSHLALPGLTLDVEPHSLVVVGAETAQGLSVVLDRGSVVCEVAPRAKDKPLVVQAGDTRVHVLGTRFGVTRMGEG